VLGGWLTEAYGWPMIFWMNPPLALAAIALLMAYAPEDRREERRFDTIGAVILAASLAAIAWALSQIGSGESETAGAGASASFAGISAAALVGGAGLVAYAYWERASSHPMTPPRLAENRAFVGLNLATLLLYAGLAMMFFLLPFELVDRRGLSATQAGLAFLPFTLAVGLLSRYFGAVADAIGPRIMLVAGSLAAALAYIWMALAQGADLLFGIIAPMTLLGVSFAVIAAPITAAVMSSVAESDEGLASGINNAASRIAQLVGVAGAAGVASFASGYQLGFVIAAALSIAGALIIIATVPPVTDTKRAEQ
jgi:predicted MFS family arabinose efflux permease